VTLLDRYLFRNVLFTCAAAVGLFSFVLMVGNVMRELMGYVLAGQIDLLTFGRLIAYLVPFVVTFALPMGVLTGVLLTLGRMSADSEITAMRSAGLSLFRVARPVILFAFLGALVALYINHQAMPWARVTYKREFADAIRANPLSMIVPRTFIRQFPGAVVYISEKNGAVLGDLWVWQLDREQRVVRMIRATRGRIHYNDAENAFMLTLEQAQVEVRKDGAPEDFREPQLAGSFGEVEALRLSMEGVFTRSIAKTKLDFLPYEDLQREKARLEQVPSRETPRERKDRERAEKRVDLVISERFNNALAVLSLALVGVPLGIKVSRRETSANLGVAVALALGYYFCTTAIGWLDKAPEWNPDVLLYAPNLLMIGAAAWLFGKVEER
jgi:lipopolysaccharide export system permease protein